MGVTTIEATPPKRSFWDWIFKRETPPPKAPRPYTPINDDSLPTLKQEPMHDLDAARARSLMYQQKTVCNGERDGKACKHFWDLTQIPGSANPDMLKDGERFRMCTYFKGMDPLMMENGKEGMAVQCNRYEPDDALVYIEKNEVYDPLTPDEYRALNAGEIKNRDDLVAYRARAKERDQEIKAAVAAEAAKAAEDNVSIDDVMGDVKETP